RRPPSPPSAPATGSGALTAPAPRRRRSTHAPSYGHGGHLEPHNRAERERAELHALAVMRRQAEVDVGEADPGDLAHAGLEHALDRVTSDAAPVVTHRHPEAAAPQPRANKEVERPVGLAVLDRVLDEWLDEERR